MFLNLIRGGPGIFPQALLRKLKPDLVHCKLGLNQVIFLRVTIYKQVVAAIHFCRRLMMFQVAQKLKKGTIFYRNVDC